jgi:ribose-phosphate pyrophosphokinase
MFTIQRFDRNLTYKSFIFPGGEVGVKLDIKDSVAYIAKTGFFAPCIYQTIVARIQNSAHVMELVMVVDALRKLDDTPIRLVLTYVPYGRQDRVCDLGESFSLKAFAGIINSLNFDKVIVIDPHSDVTGAVFNNVEIISQFKVINAWPNFIKKALGCVLVSPDAGANKKTFELAKFFNHSKFIRADKLRDMATGNIKETIVYETDLSGCETMICDDLCDGGRTFIELAKVLKDKGAKSVDLYVTHGIFSKGSQPLLDAGIDQIWTTNSFREDIKEENNIHVLDVEKTLRLFDNYR